MAILDYSEQIWRDALGIPAGSEPAGLVLEGTWWRAAATQSRLALLSDVRELAFPEMFIGTWNGLKIAYCCAYGAARAVEPAHIFAQLGTRVLVQIGTCGSLDADAVPGSVALPEECRAEDGISQHYGAAATVHAAPDLVAFCHGRLRDRGIEVARTRHLTWPSLFAQSDEMCTTWASEGVGSIDMETTAVIAAADRFGAKALALLSVWDALANGRTFMDPLPPEDAARLRRSNEIVFDVALEAVEAANAH